MKKTFFQRFSGWLMVGMVAIVANSFGMAGGDTCGCPSSGGDGSSEYSQNYWGNGPVYRGPAGAVTGGSIDTPG